MRKIVTGLTLWFLCCYVLGMSWWLGNKIQPQIIEVPIIRTKEIYIPQKETIEKIIYVSGLIKVQMIDRWQIRKLTPSEKYQLCRTPGAIPDNLSVSASKNDFYVVTYNGTTNGTAGEAYTFLDKIKNVVYFVSHATTSEPRMGSRDVSTRTRNGVTTNRRMLW